jgi:hypothetical protein
MTAREKEKLYVYNIYVCDGFGRREIERESFHLILSLILIQTFVIIKLKITIKRSPGTCLSASYGYLQLAVQIGMRNRAVMHAAWL